MESSFAKAKQNVRWTFFEMNHLWDSVSLN